MFSRITVILCFLNYSFALDEVCHSRGQHGTCQRIQNCLEAITLVQQNGKPDICEFEGLEPVICCLSHEEQESPEQYLDNLNDLESNIRRFVGSSDSDSDERNHFPGRRPRPPRPNDFRRPGFFGDSDERNHFPGQRPRPPRPNDFRATRRPFLSSLTPLKEEVRTSTKFPATTASPTTMIGSLESDIPTSVKKCLKYYPTPHFPSFVTGGEKSLPKQFPHMALIGFGDDENNKQWLCGGSLISKRFVLTAGHCLFSNQQGNAKWVHLGDLDLSTEADDASPQDFKIIRRIPYPDFKPPQKYHDIALLELDKEATLSAYIAPACLQTTKQINDTSMTATGWGKTDFAGGSSSFLMQVNLGEVAIDQCRKTYGADETRLPNGIVDDIQICAGGIKGKDTCGGDSGGPLQVKNHFRSFVVKVHTVVGITSFGKACGLTPSPGVYTRVSYYTKWIESIVWADDHD